MKITKWLAIVNCCVMLIKTIIKCDELGMRRHTTWQVSNSDIPNTAVRVISTNSYMKCVANCRPTNVCLFTFYQDIHKHCTIVVTRREGDDSDYSNNSYTVTSPNDKIHVSLNYWTIIWKDATAITITVASSSCLPPQSVDLEVTQTLVQSRVDGCLSFNRTWPDYENGFGHPTGNYWAGLSTLRSLTASGSRKLRIEMKKYDDSTWYWTEYSSFQVSDSADSYRLSLSGYDTSSTGGDSMTKSLSVDNRQFSTIDIDHDALSINCCAERGAGGYWYSNCGYANVNSLWASSALSGMQYMGWYTVTSSFKAIDKIRIIVI